MTQTILFIDEEKFVLNALKRSFRKMRQEWDMRFADGPAEALKILANESIEVIVSETIFQGQSGLDFLEMVRQGHPHSVRIILSGYSDRNVVLKSVDLAHQYLAKPCEDEELKATINRAFMIKKLISHQGLKEIVSRIDSLPTLPATYIELVQELETEDSSIEKIGDIISKDIGLTTKILKMVNSSFFGLRQQITAPNKAVSMLGLDLVKAMALSSGTFDKFKHLKVPGFSLDKMWQHAMLTSAFAKIIAQKGGLERRDTDTVFMAGLLHDVGKLLIAAHLPDSFAVINKLAEKISIPIFEAEEKVIGTNHSSIGAYLLGLWGLPQAIFDATAFHHNHHNWSEAKLNPAAIIHIANALAECGEDIHQPQGIVNGLDYAYLKKANLLESLIQWKAACADYSIEINPH
jgi:putative nucleotidyltransferase with HDIG domain